MKENSLQKNNRVSKEQWLLVALETLETKGFETVKIEKLAKKLQVSRSGFYWHFKNREDLLHHLLEYWAKEYTQILTDDTAIKEFDAKTRLLITMETVRKKRLAKYDLAMNSWAKVDKLVNNIVQKVINMRLDFTRGIFKDLGFYGDELEMRARVFLCYHAWEEVMFPDVIDDEKSRELRLEMFIK